MNEYLIAASVLSFITACIHVFLGGPDIARPLLESRDLRPVPKYTNYYCWHIVSITLFAMSGGFAYAGFWNLQSDLGGLMVLLSSAFAVWSLVLVSWKRQSFLRMPQWALFVLISAVAIPGLA